MPDLEQKARRKRWTKAEIDRLLLVGGQMANICFNLAQKDEIRQEWRESMKSLQIQWDDARMSGGPR